MVAEFAVYLDTGGADGNPGTQTNTDPLGPPNIRYKRADNPTIDNNNPCIIPAQNVSRSRPKHTYIRCVEAPNTQVDNIQIYTDGVGFGTGISLVVGTETPSKTRTTSPGYIPGNTEDGALTSLSSISTTSDLFSFTAAAPKSVSISEVGGIIDAPGETSDYIVTQLETVNTASPGNLNNEIITYEYDEI